MNNCENVGSSAGERQSEPAIRQEQVNVKIPSASMTPLRLMIVLTLSIFVGEMVIMFFLATLPPLSMTAEAILDGFLITALSFPFLYYLSFRPLILHISERKKAQEALRKAHDGLEVRVQERTAELSEANTHLKSEISERRRAEEALRESENDLRLLSNSLLTAQETERKRIAYELHDELGQSLTVLKLQLRSIEQRVGDGQGDMNGSCDEALEFVDRMIENLRRLSRDLSPAILEDLGLSAALNSLIQSFSRHSGVKVSLDARVIDEPFPEKAQILVYRIFQEAFSNIAKHADASNISVKIGRENSAAFFLIEDDGKGFDLNEAKQRHSADRGMGLTAMDERARMMGGSLVISSGEKGGTRVALTVPVAAEGGGKL